jgi:hypothetical protein
MIRVTVELISAIDPARNRTLAMMDIANNGQTTMLDPELGSYTGRTYRGRDRATLDEHKIQRTGVVRHWPRHAVHVWCLVAAMLKSMGYGYRSVE